MKAALGSGVRRLFVLGIVFCAVMASARGQNAAPPQGSSTALAGLPVPRVIGPVDETSRVALRGNTHPHARAQYDRGAVADSLPLHRMLLLLQRSPEQENALRNLLDQQQSKSSGSYHQWLSPQQFGQQFGPADADVQAVTNWLASHGFQVSRVSAGKTVIEFSGTAGQVRQAFRTEIHRYAMNGEEHLANASDPSIPAALAPVVAGTVSLHNFPKHPQSRLLGLYRKDNSTGKVTPRQAAAGKSAGPAFSFFSGSCPGGTCYALGPADFATIYDVPTSGSPGAGQTVAIVGDSEICTVNSPDWNTSYMGPNGNTTCSSDDVAAFRSQFGLSANSPNVIVDGPDPGFNFDETEGDLDVEWAGAVARNSTIDFVIAEDTETTFGTDLAAEYVVDNNLAPVLSESFGECEGFLGNSGNQFEADLWEQAAAQGITVIVSSADSGSAGCDDPNTEVTAQDGVFVNGIASTPFNVAAGGTDFDITASGYPGTYWNDPNHMNNVTGQSVKSYIPETSWNDSCAQNFTGSLVTCGSTSSSSPLLNIVGGGGGQSNCVVNNGTYCTSGYAKPPWQGGAYVGSFASDATRDIPDIALFSSDGLNTGSFYIICEADLNPGGSGCNLSAPYFDFVGVGGTSSAAPTFAGAMALINQQVGARQGNANYILYYLANNEPSGANCSSTSVPTSGCYFNDVTKGNNSVPCAGGTTSCSYPNSSHNGVLEQSGQIAWNSISGFDLATGLGSVNIGNLINNWSTAVGQFKPTTTALQMCGQAPCTLSSSSTFSMVHGQTADVKVTVTPNSGSPPSTTTPENAALIMTDSTCAQNKGSADVFTTSTSYSVANANLFPLSISGSTLTTASGANTKYLAGGSYYVKAHYAGDGTLGGSDSSNCILVNVSPENSTTTVMVPVVNLTTVPPSVTNVPGVTPWYGDSIILRADVKGATSLEENAQGTVTFKDNGVQIGSPVPLNTEGYAEMQTGANVDGTQMTPLGVGAAHIITATYTPPGGSSSYNGSSGTATTFAVLQAQTATTFTTSSASVASGNPVSITVFIDTALANNPSGGSAGAAPTGTVTFKVAASTPPAPLSFPYPNDLLIAGLAAALGFLLLVSARAPRRRLGTAFAAALLAVVATAAIGCGGGGNSGSTGGSGSGGGTGTTVGTATLLQPTTGSQGFVAATATVNFTPSGTEKITAMYSGDTNYKSSSTVTTFQVTVH